MAEIHIVVPFIIGTGRERMQTLIDTREVILNLKKVKNEKKLSLDKIVSLTEQNGEAVSKTTISRVFADGSEDIANTFRYENTLRPIANALLDIETIELNDDADTQAIKSILHLKRDLIADYAKQNEELKAEIQSIKDKEKMKYHEKLEKETKHFQDSLAFLSKQIELKDQRIDALLTTTTELMTTNNKLVTQLMDCPIRKVTDNEG